MARVVLILAVLGISAAFAQAGEMGRGLRAQPAYLPHAGMLKPGRPDPYMNFKPNTDPLRSMDQDSVERYHYSPLVQGQREQIQNSNRVDPTFRNITPVYP